MHHDSLSGPPKLADHRDESPWKRVLWVAVSVLIVVLTLYVRKADSFENPQFWAEDGKIFFSQAHEMGLRSYLEPYSGYYHSVPRLVAHLATFFPYEIAPAIYNFAALLALVLLAVNLHSPRLALPAPTIYAAALVLVPHRQGEIFLNLTNIQWPLALLLFLVSVKSPAEGRAGKIFDWLIILMAGLSGPFVVILLPIFFLQAVRYRNVASILSAAVATVAATIQVLAYRNLPIVVPPTANHSDEAWMPLLSQRVMGNLALGDKAPYTIEPSLLMAGGSAIAVLLAWRLVSLSSRRLFIFGSAFYGVSILALVFYKFRAAADLLIPPAGGNRYFYVPYVLFCWVCITLFLYSRKRVDKVLAVLLLCLVLRSSLISGFESPPLRDYQWAEHIEKFERDGAAKIPINPEGWSVRLQRK